VSKNHFSELSEVKEKGNESFEKQDGLLIFKFSSKFFKKEAKF